VSVVRSRQVEGVMDNPDLSTWPDLFGFCWASIIWAFVCCGVVSYVARHLIDALRYLRVVTPTVTPEHFCDHEMIMKALVCACVMVQTDGCSLFGLCCLAFCWSVYSMRRVAIMF
jgi:hypothetical protein